MSRRKQRSTCGESLCFHGSYSRRSTAEAKRKTLSKKARILTRWIGGNDFRYIVVTPNKRGR